MMQRWLCGRSAGSQLPAAPGWRRGGSREPPAAGGHQTGGAQGNGGAQGHPLAQEPELGLAGSVPRAAGTGATHGAAGIAGWPRPPSLRRR